MWDQPWAEWRAQRYAGYIAYILDQEKTAKEVADVLSDDDLKVLLKIRDIRVKLAEEKRRG